MNKKKLAEIGKIIRCPIAHTDNPKVPMTRVVYHRDIDRPSGIVNVRDAVWERLEYSPSRSTYELRPGDTVMVFNGVRDRVGICGLVVDDDTRAVPATSLCVIRPLDIDPVWLFHRLRTMREELLKFYQEKKSIGYISMKDLGAVEIEKPTADSVKEVNEIWQGNIGKWRESRRLMDEIAKANGEIESVLGANQELLFNSASKAAMFSSL